MDLHKKSKKELIEKIEKLQKRLQDVEQPLVENTISEMEKSEMRLREALENIKLFGIAIQRDGKIVYCNPYALQLTGWTRQEIVGRSYFEVFVPEEERQARIEDYDRAMYRQGFWYDSDRSILTRDGRVLFINFNSVILNNHKGEITGITKIGEDVSERKRVTLALQRSNEALQDLFDNSNDLIFICSVFGNFLFANKAFKKKIGYENEELEQLNVKEIIAEKSKIKTYRSVLKLIKGEQLYKFETVLVSKKGRLIYLEGNISFKYENGKPTALRGILYDITDKIRAEKAQTLYYSIANLTVKSKNLDQLYHNIRQELGKVIEVKNFYIKLFNEDKTEILFPYYSDEARQDVIITKRKAGKGLTDYVMKHEKAMFLYEEEIAELIKRENLTLFGPMPKIWIGVPLKFENEVIGLISVKSYRDRNTYTTNDLELLDFISGQIALAIQRKQDEEKINTQTARLEAIFESSSHMMWSLDRKNQLTSFNQNYANSIEAQYGIRPILNSNLLLLKNELLKKDLYEFWLLKYKLAFDGHKQHFELKTQMPDGSFSWREVFLNPIMLNDGTIREVSAIAHDITEKKLSEIALQESELKFRSIFESFQDIYYHADLEGKLTLISPSIFELLGYTPQEVIGRKVYEFMAGSNSIRLEDFINYLLQNTKIKNYETTLKAKNGTLIQSISNVKLVMDSNQKPIGIEGVVRDITELKKATEEVLRAKEIAEKSLKVKESFLANMSHEIRTPMNGVIGMIDLMMDTNLNQEQYEYMQTIKKSSETLMHILNDILDLSKIEAGKMKLHQKPMNLHLTIEKVYTLFLQQAGIKNIGLEYEMDKSIPAYIIGDETRILQIISNLTSNAVKFTEKGNVKIVASLVEQKNKRLKIKISVKDSGIGIDADNVNLLFNTFSQLDNSSSKSYAGTGLGLAISKELTKLMNGEIGVESEKGKGSNFWFTFTTKATDSPEKMISMNNPEIQEYSFVGEKKPFILVVDDNSVNRMVAEKILTKAGCKVDLASSGEESIQKIKLASESEMYQVVFMDIQMPDMDGVETTQHIKKLSLPKIPPIVAMTAYSMKEDRRKFLAKGLDDYIPKPIKAQILIQKVKELIEKTDKSASEQVVNSEPSLLLNFQKSILNLQVLEQLRKYGGEELILDSLAEFEADAQQLLETCKEDLETQDYQNALRVLHTLKGNAGTLGVEEIATQATDLERKLKNENYENIEQDFDNLEKSFQFFQDNYKQLIQ